MCILGSAERVVVSLVVLLSAVSCIMDKPAGADLAVGDLIPDFTVTMNDGTEVTGASLCEGVSVIMFFTTVCPDCRETLPQMQKIYDEYVSQGVRFALVSREDGSESVAQYWSQQGFSMPYSAQDDRRVYELFARTLVPRVYICRNGVIKTIFTDDPNPDYNAMKSGIEGALNKY